MTVTTQPAPAISLAKGNVPDWLRALHVIDVDSHYSEPWDLWTRLAPAEYKDRVPHVAMVNGDLKWVVDGIPIRSARAASIILPDGSKEPGIQTHYNMIDRVHPASYDVKARLKLLDELGVWAQVLYPNAAGFGSQNFGAVKDRKLRDLCATVYNDAMAEVQQASGDRLLPVALLPWWDIDASVAEIRRVRKMGFRGIMLCSDPQEIGLPDLAEPFWNPLWDACCELEMPVSFHIGASDSSLKTNAGEGPWPSFSEERAFITSSTMLFMANARIMCNLIIGGVLERFPKLKIVSVESGIGWIPFLLEVMDYDFADAPTPFLPMKPSEYFRRQIYGTFWFEKLAPQQLLGAIGVKNVLFETDIPHGICLYPGIQDYIVNTFSDVDPEARRRVLQDNAAELYRVDLPKT